MKVAFKLTEEQILIANNIRSELVAEFGKEEGYHFLGNINPQEVDGNFPVNTNQYLHVEGDKLTYEGERCPLQQDGGLKTLLRIAGGNLDVLEVVEYQTSDKRLKWHETLYDYIVERSTWMEFCDYLKNGNHKPDIPGRFPEKVRLLRTVRKDERKAYVEFNREEVKEMKQLIKFMDLDD